MPCQDPFDSKPSGKEMVFNPERLGARRALNLHHGPRQGGLFSWHHLFPNVEEWPKAFMRVSECDLNVCIGFGDRRKMEISHRWHRPE